MQLKGLHHVSSITANAVENFHFYTEVLGMRLIKKTVNQDDTSVYHLFYGDEIGSPGTEFTFFEIPMAARNHDGNNSISELALRVQSDQALDFWQQRFKMLNVAHGEITRAYGRKSLRFKDPEGQRLILVSDETNLKGVPGGKPWDKSSVSKEHAIVGLGPVTLTVPEVKATERVLTDVLGLTKKGSYASDVEGQPDILVYEMGQGGTGAEVHLEERKDLPRQRLGRGGVHHVAFRVASDEELQEWIKRINQYQFNNSGYVDRFYFHSLYFREPNGILFELATDGPGFATDEDKAHLGEALALPPFLEPNREAIEAKLKPLSF
ncbi:putative ring-cleaving dioxygenase MhqA [Pullulanibacillus camelliae]|uniref:Putative ring-cleaving dioxygenase MhqA n=1 Tax=Pullulanibacillus camelliae TaxID=1707096 RepID=A0A8J3E283_9BACL|nr:ring-cleaving dioxygenase [Pullulanibacillus camelliae]GGE56561.1 putative ring-cleaving dioxygenase MhqA [Pullulanibacillus camelliae]